MWWLGLWLRLRRLRRGPISHDGILLAAGSTGPHHPALLHAALLLQQLGLVVALGLLDHARPGQAVHLSGHVGRHGGGGHGRVHGHGLVPTGHRSGLRRAGGLGRLLGRRGGHLRTERAGGLLLLSGKGARGRVRQARLLAGGPELLAGHGRRGGGIVGAWLLEVGVGRGRVGERLAPGRGLVGVEGGRLGARGHLGRAGRHVLMRTFGGDDRVGLEGLLVVVGEGAILRGEGSIVEGVVVERGGVEVTGGVALGEHAVHVHVGGIRSRPGLLWGRHDGQQREAERMARRWARAAATSISRREDTKDAEEWDKDAAGEGESSMR
nr:hypothetical protein CFP56_38838 [Quercus suber]